MVCGCLVLFCTVQLQLGDIVAVAQAVPAILLSLLKCFQRKKWFCVGM